MPVTAPINVLFLCTGNSARSILAEALLNKWGAGELKGYSAGSFPKGKVHPMALQLLSENRCPTDGLRSKSWDEFAAPGAPQMNFVITVCDQAAGEACPFWPGQPVTAHWGLPDPAAVSGSDAEVRAAFQSVFDVLERRMQLLTSANLDAREPTLLKQRIRELGAVFSEGTRE